MSEVEIEWPWQYSFPPFFTLQPHPETRSKQVSAWKSLILEYCQKNRLFIIDVREAHQLPLFHNSSINRKLDPSVIISILSELSKTGNAAALDKPRHRWEVYWHTLEEWASMIYEYVCDSGMQNSVLTLFELAQGDDVQGRDFAGIHTDVLIKALRVLESERKCELILSDEDQGVKFF
ncbi:ESCRT-II domain containing protein [Asbolus verrucosus]|uniref:Vacuolar protein-sorting-associated protein 25 n=1 Tax=Asbolus verrucosus TaxID=1661398 RepID=A0A482W231_ASBVE|nr:ESCRT-II domain containing protein [Asbolus verrucosus]